MLNELERAYQEALDTCPTEAEQASLARFEKYVNLLFRLGWAHLTDETSAVLLLDSWIANQQGQARPIEIGWPNLNLRTNAALYFIRFIDSPNKRWWLSRVVAPLLLKHNPHRPPDTRLSAEVFDTWIDLPEDAE